MHHPVFRHIQVPKLLRQFYQPAEQRGKARSVHLSHGFISLNGKREGLPLIRGPRKTTCAP